MSTNEHPTFDPTTPTSNDLTAAISYTSSKLSASWPQVLEIKDSISNGGSIPSISEADQVIAIITDQTPAGALKTAQSQAQTIVTEWSQAAAAGTTGFGDLSAQVSRLFAGTGADTQNSAGEGLTGLLGSLGTLTSSLGAGYATALVLAVGEAHAPAGAWAEATATTGVQNNPQNSTDTGAGSGADDTSAA